MSLENNTGYNGNPLLRKAGIKIEWTHEQVLEYARCKQDPIYFAEKYIKIVDVDRGFVNIKLYDFQKDIITKFNNNRKTIVNSSRQIGKTTTATVIILHYILFNDSKQVALLANKGAAAREILDRIQSAYEALPLWIQQGIKEWNKGSVTLENKSKIIASATTGSACRGKSFALLYIDETAFVEGWDEFAGAVLPTITSGKKTKILYTSTPNGLNHFHSIMTKAKDGRNGFAWAEVPWWEVPGRDEAWKNETLASINFDMEKFNQEFCCSFIGSSNTLISSAALKALVDQIPIVEKYNIKQYKAPIDKHQYVIVADVSRGKGLDYSAASVVDISRMPYEQVCVFRDNYVTPADYASELFKLSKIYNDATILVEINDNGEQVSYTLYNEFECETLIFTESNGRSGKRISSGFGKTGIDMGIRTTKTVKNIGCSLLKLLVEQQQLVINDDNTIYELSRFSRKGASYEAESGATDDIVMGLVLFAWMTDQSYFKELTDINTLQRLRDRTEEEIENSLMPFGIHDDGSDYHNDNSVIDLTTTPHHPDFGNIFF